MTLVSVIVPNYNHSVYLDRRVQSILNQTCQNFEIILLDDCSTDNSKEILERYCHHPKVSQLVINEKNSGFTFQQWKKGIELAKGEWIWLAESDDWCEPNFLEELTKLVEADREAVLAFCQSIVVTPENKVLKTTNAEYLTERLDGKEFLRKKMLGTNQIVNASMAIFKKKAFETIPSGYEKMKYCGDWLFWVHICMQGNIYISGKHLNYYLRHENNVATGAVPEGLDFLEGDAIFKFIKDNVSLSSSDLQHGLFMRLRIYFDWYHLFNKDVNKKVLQSLYSLHPSVKQLIRKRKLKERIRKAIFSMFN